MVRYTLPFEIDNVDLTGDISIDMSKLSFDCSNDKQKRSSFIFLRNAGIKAELDFSDCSYKDREEFLLLYLQEAIEVEAEVLASTWIEILSAKDGGGIALPSILSSEEIQQFLKDNEEFVKELYRLINSLPIFALYWSPKNGDLYDTNDFIKTDYDGIKIENFSKLANYDAFLYLVDGATESAFYTQLFIKEEYHINMMMNKLPFFSLLSIMTASPEMQDQAIERINEFLTPPEIPKPEGEEEIANE